MHNPKLLNIQMVLLPTVAQILHTVVSNDQRDWSDKCLMVEFTINISVNATTGYAPFELNYGYMP